MPTAQNNVNLNGVSGQISLWSEHLAPRYTINRVIGSGAYGTVAQAYDNNNKRTVAVKRMGQIFDDLIDCKRVLREIALLNRLDSQYVVKVLDVIIPPDRMIFNEVYLILQIEDTDFKRLFRHATYLHELHIQTLIYHLLLGVKYVHSAGIFHRDIKPANCLVNQDCGVVLCDFGLARTRSQQNENFANSNPDEDQVLQNEEYSRSKPAMTNHVVTRWYRAPELCLLSSDYTQSVDVWSAGCIFAELLQCLHGNEPNVDQRGAIFPGNFCFPLSPPPRRGATRSQSSASPIDQLLCIFRLVGQPSDEDLESLRQEAQDYVRMLVSQNPDAQVDPAGTADRLREKFPGSSDAARDLLRKLLVFNPKERITVDEALQHPYFMENTTVQQGEGANALTFRPRAPQIAPEPVVLPFDDSANLSEDHLRYFIIKEVQRYHDVTVPAELLQRCQNSGLNVTQ